MKHYYASDGATFVYLVREAGMAGRTRNIEHEETT